MKSISDATPGMIVWNNGYWFFMTMSDSPSEARALEDAVGY